MSSSISWCSSPRRVLRPDLNLLEKSLSYYAVGHWGVVQAVAFVALGISSVALALALPPRRALASRWTWPIVLLLIISGIASLGLVWYPMDAPGPATILGDATRLPGTIDGVAQLAAALAFTIAVRTDPAWGGLFVPALAMFSLALAGALLSQVAIWWPHLGIPAVATVRLLVIPLVALWGLVALRCAGHARRRSTNPPAGRHHPGVHADQVEPAEEAGVLDLDAAVLDDFQPRLAGDAFASSLTTPSCSQRTFAPIAAAARDLRHSSIRGTRRRSRPVAEFQPVRA